MLTDRKASEANRKIIFKLVMATVVVIMQVLNLTSCLRRLKDDQVLRKLKKHLNASKELIWLSGLPFAQSRSTPTTRREADSWPQELGRITSGNGSGNVATACIYDR